MTDHKKEFSKIFDSLCGAHSRWEIWSDFIHLAAYDISNVIDGIHREKRTEYRESIAKKYSPAEMERFAGLFTTTVEALDRSTEQDFLGELYMSLNLGNKNAGQFFTPYNICEATGSLIGSSEKIKADIERNGWTAAVDPCVGGGAMLIAFANHCLKHDINYQRNVLFVGQDLDATVAKMAYIQLSLIGAAGYIVIGDSLTEPLVCPNGSPLFAPMQRETYVTPMYCSDLWEGRRLAYRMDRILERIDSAEPRKAPEPEQEQEPEREPEPEQDFEPVQMSLF